MRYLRILATGALAAGALCGLYIAFCILPKVTMAENDLHTTVPDWIAGPVALSYLGDWVIDSIYLLGAVLFVAVIVALLPFIAESIHRVAYRFVYTIAWAAAACAIYLLSVAAAGMIFANGAISQRDQIYASVLDHFALRESADGKFEEIQAFFARINSVRLVEVTDAASLTHEQRSQQLRGLFYCIKETKDVPFLKQVLATTDWFRPEVTRNKLYSEPILEAAALCGAPAGNIDKFYDWLEPKIGTDGWTKLPLHVMVFDK
jgi:hypothetical protein